MSDLKTCPECLSSVEPQARRCSHCGCRQPDAAGLYRNVPGKLIGGVCAALAAQLGLDLTLLRVLAVASTALTGGLVFWVYTLLWVLTPFQPHGRSPARQLFDWLNGVLNGLLSSGPGSPNHQNIE